MAGFSIKIDRARFDRRLQALEEGIARPRQLMQIWGEIAITSINQNFEQQGRPQRWQPLSPVTVRLKGHDRALIGKTGSLRRVGYQVADDHVTIGTSPAASKYAAIQQFGGQAGRNHKVKIPARPYLVLQDEDVEEMKETGLVYLKNLGK